MGPSGCSIPNMDSTYVGDLCLRVCAKSLFPFDSPVGDIRAEPNAEITTMSEQIRSAVRSFLTGKWILTLATLLLVSLNCGAHPIDATPDQLNAANQMLNKAITDAGERLERQDCSALLGIDAAEALKQ